MLNIGLIENRSKELKIPVSNMLYGCCVEELVIFISENYKKNLWVMNDKVLGLAAYKKGNNNPLYLAYMSEEYDAQTFIKKFAMSVVSAFHHMRIKVKTSFSGNEKIVFIMEIEKMTVPISVVIKDVSGINTFPKEKTLMLSLQNAKTVKYMVYPIEQSVSDMLFEIFDKLELLNDMDMYLNLYDLIKSEAIEGRKVKESLAERSMDKAGFDMSRLEILKSYNDYTYMKKKWKVVKRRNDRENLSWEEVHENVIKFAEPIYLALINNEVFFGDWMPDLERYLD